MSSQNSWHPSIRSVINLSERESAISLSHFSVRETFNYPTEHKFWFPLPELHTDQSGSISNSILICLVRTGKWEVCCVASPHRSHSNCLAGWCWYSNTYILHIEKKIRDKSAFTGVRITLKPGQHQGTPHTSLLTLIFSESSPIGQFILVITQHHTTQPKI